MTRPALPAAISLCLIASCAGIGEHEAAFPDALEVAALLAEGALDVPPIGAYAWPVSGASPAAQAWFDQGIRYIHGFNQDQAAACFARAALASPTCPMAWWGISHTFAVDINNQGVPEHEAVWALVASREAERIAHLSTPLEQRLIAAAATRAVVPAPGPTERSHLDLAYSTAMEETWKTAPSNPDVGALYAESLMLLQPWAYWTLDFEPLERAEEIVALLERCMELDQNHPLANHLYIHMVESSGDPARGIPSADRLGELMPGSGHLVHMPSHIYINVGRYEDAIQVNERAVELDRAYFDQYKKPTFYLHYFAHNIMFTSFGAMMEGRRELALSYADQLEELSPDAVIEKFAPFIDGLNALRLHVFVRFGMWEEILAFPEYAEFRKASRSIRHYARTIALANLGRTDAARQELVQLDTAIAETPEDWTIAFNPSHTVLGLARMVAEAEICWREGDAAKAIAILHDTCSIEQQLVYTEPPPWMIPIRHALGAIQLASGDALGAEASYEEDLSKHKENAWSLLGLHQALTKLGKLDQATALEPRLHNAWTRADIEPPASCYCGVPLNQQ